MELKDSIISKTREIHDTKFSFEKVTTIPTVNTKQLTFGCNAWTFDAVVLYIDMRHSTQLLSEHRRNVVAKLHMAYYNAIVRIAKADGGEIRSFNGDSLLVFYVGNTKDVANKAVKSALKMHFAITHLVNPTLEGYEDINFGIGIDCGNIVATKVGIGGDETVKDLIWLGDSVNKSTRISDLCEKPFYVGISQAVYDKLDAGLLSYTKTIDNGVFGQKTVKYDVWARSLFQYNSASEYVYKTKCYLEII